jgi:transcriptional regulator with XRE-family HTH domain
MGENENIFSRLATYRNNKGLSQEDFAHKLGTVQQKIARFERGTKIPHTFMFEFLKVYGLKDFLWLLTGKENIDNPESGTAEPRPDRKSVV